MSERQYLVPSAARWPRGLGEIEGAPTGLWARGRVELLDALPRVAIVGTRAPTPYGESQAARFAAAFAAAGACVVSGLARGVDRCAHAAALDAGGATVAVLGSGVDRPWPGGPLTERMLEEGLLLSELAPEQSPRPHHFPLRNRLISGLCEAVVVIEAAPASGSLITARWAADQGRAVFALPGRVDHPMARGTHRLIREGASLVESPREVLEELGLPGPPASTGSSAGSSRGPRAREDRPGSAPVLAALRGETLGADELAERLGRDARDVLTELVQLELAGRVHRCPGGLYRLART